MVLDNPIESNSDIPIPSFENQNNNGTNIVENGLERESDVIEIIYDYETIVVPRMLSVNWMNEISKSKSKPFYNSTEQSLVGHIYPGVEILMDIYENVDYVEKTDLRNLIALWTIHDIHKIVENNGDEFEIDSETVEIWVKKLSLDEFVNSDINISDYHSCVVAHHNSDEANVGDSTVKFTEYRPYIRLVDALVSISDFDEFLENVETRLNNVFCTPEENFTTATHQVEFEDSIMRCIANKTLKEKLSGIGLKPIDLRDYGVMYARSESVEYPDMVTFTEEVVEKFLTNLKDAYPPFRNKSFLGGDIDSPQVRNGYWVMPRVYEITELAKLCLTKEELIQRIVQASIEQQNRPWDISKESKRQIEIISDLTKFDIPKNSLIEGLAALVHTVFREILPEIVDESHSEPFQRTFEAAIIHIFGVSEEIQEEIASLIKNNSIKTSLHTWPIKYLIAHDLNNGYTSMYNRKDRQNELMMLLLERLSDFDKWDKYCSQSQESIRREIFLQFARKTKIDGEYLYKKNPEFLNIIADHGFDSTCGICGFGTSQSEKSPDLISHRDFDILNEKFITRKSDKPEFEIIDMSTKYPHKPICVGCQTSLTVRAQQIDFNHESDRDRLFISVYSPSSISVSSYTRFTQILKYLKTTMFSDYGNNLSFEKVSEIYKEYMENYLKQEEGINSLADRNGAYSIGSKYDEAISIVNLPNNSEYNRIRGAICATTAALMSGVHISITTKPQFQVNCKHEDIGLVDYGPDMKEYGDLLSHRKSIRSIPDKLQILDRLVQMSNYTSNPEMTLKMYGLIQDKSIVPGSQIHMKTSHMLSNNSKEQIKAARNAINIDSIAAKEDIYAQELLLQSQKIADNLGNILPRSDVDVANTTMNIVWDKLSEMGMFNSKEEVINSITEELSYIDELDLKAIDLEKGGKGHKFAQCMVETYEIFGNDSSKTFESIRNPMLSAIVTRSQIYTINNTR